MTRRGTRRLPEFVDVVVETTSRALTSAGAALARDPRDLGLEIAAGVCEAFRGSYFYIPRFAEFAMDRRDRAIASAYASAGPDNVRPYTGARVRQLAREYSLTTVQVYCILRRQRDSSLQRPAGGGEHSHRGAGPAAGLAAGRAAPQPVAPQAGADSSPQAQVGAPPGPSS